MPCHQALAEALRTYIEAAGIVEDRKGWVFRTARGHNGSGRLGRACSSRRLPAQPRSARGGNCRVSASHRARSRNGYSALARLWSEARQGVQVKLLPQDGEFYVLAQSRDRVAKEWALRRRQLKWL
jgi:hypothetical protein